MTTAVIIGIILQVLTVALVIYINKFVRERLGWGCIVLAMMITAVRRILVVWEDHYNPKSHALDSSREILGFFVSALFLAGFYRVLKYSKITYREESELTLSRERLNAVVGSSDDAIITKNLQGIIQSWNPAAERIFGYAPAEMIGSSINKLIPPELHEEEKTILAMISRGEYVQHLETERLAKDGTRRYISISNSPIRDMTGKIIGATKVARDITGQKRAQQELHEQRVRLQSVIELSEDAIITISLTGIIQTWNPAAERIFGYTATEAIGQQVSMLMPAESTSEEAHMLAKLAKGERVERLDTQRVRKDGSIIFASVTLSPIKNQDGVIVAASKIARDMSDKQLHEYALKASEASFKALAEEKSLLLEREQTARHQVEEANTVKDRFLATLSHELRTPLNAILGWAQLSSRRHTDPEMVKEGLRVIERNARSQAHIIEDLLDMNRILSGTLLLQKEEVELSTVVEGAIETITPAAIAKSIQITKVFDYGPKLVLGDPIRLKQIVWNLLTNAVKFSHERGTIVVSLLRKHPVGVVIEVSDTGRGISAAFLPSVFERFSQQDSSASRQYGGLGLGLSIVKQLVEMHSGSIEVFSKGENQGSTFKVILPQTETQQPSIAEQTTVTESDISHDRFVNVHALVVDDEVDARNLVKVLLEQEGATVSLAESAEEALRILDKEHISLIISDIGMPNQNGYQFIEKVRGHISPTIRNLPAAALTAYARSDDVTTAMDSGFQIHISKPLDSEQLLTALAKLIKQT